MSLLSKNHYTTWWLKTTIIIFLNSEVKLGNPSAGFAWAHSHGCIESEHQLCWKV